MRFRPTRVRGHSVQQDGLTGDLRKIPRTVLRKRALLVQKNMALMGLGYQSVVRAKTDEFSRMDRRLAAKIEQCANDEADPGGVAAEPPMPVLLTAACHLLNWQRRSRTSRYVDAAWGAAHC